MSRFKVILPVLLALVIAGVGSYFLFEWMKLLPEKKAAQAEKLETQEVVVASSDLPWGTKLEPDMMKTVRYLKDSIPPGAAGDIESITGRVLIVPMKMSEPILANKMAPEDVTAGGVAAVLEPGMRAVAVKGDKVSGISGFIRPGNKVDVYVTITNPDTNQSTTKQVLENILVLATGVEMYNDENNKQAPVDVYTLAVTPAQAEELLLVASKGRLQFALRNQKDVTTVLTKGSKITRTLTNLSPQNPPPPRVEPGKPPKPIRKRPTHTVEILVDGQVVTKKFEL